MKRFSWLQNFPRLFKACTKVPLHKDTHIAPTRYKHPCATPSANTALPGQVFWCYLLPQTYLPASSTSLLPCSGLLLAAIIPVLPLSPVSAQVVSLNYCKATKFTPHNHQTIWLSSSLPENHPSSGSRPPMLA
ncbi:hypothetical protein DSO57_1007274 [Entomophthora muscae]|uniref:Uncharacterized protein n=1 Tax=Entomophthora muscae TaxID=34485 RepID=A0ACC2UU15_9FUNG|nr:hypothetical protein DSO57_1007274 [Entomophthora muscae]